MPKLKIKDLTPELMKKLAACEAPADVVALMKEQGYEFSEKAADRLMKQIGKAENLSEADLAQVAGGFNSGGSFGS